MSEDIGSLRFVIVGHVDHGKSTLIGRLLLDTGSINADKLDDVGRSLAFASDHLCEEREQGITIDTSQIFFKSGNREYVIIDAPGHVEFVRNMITGASQAEAAILIIDALEGIKEQTKRHAYILHLLGLKQVVVAINKMDLVDFSQDKFKRIKDDADKFLKSIGIKTDSYAPISAMNGDNVAAKSDKMDWYTGPTILENLAALRNSPSVENNLLVFPVQDAYKIGDKRIAVGKIDSGSLSRGEEIMVLPSGQATRVRSIEKFGESDVKNARAFESIGITTDDALFLDRGDVICDQKRLPHLADRFKANVFWLSEQDFNKHESIILRLATQEISCKIESIAKRINSSSMEVIEEDADLLKYLDLGEVVIKAKRPIVVEEFNDIEELGRFIFVRKNDTCAGGIVTGILQE